MPVDFDTIDCLRQPWERELYFTVDGTRYNPITKFTFGDEERTEKKMDIRDKICDKCGKRYSIADMRIERDGEYVDKTCYFANATPLEDYPKLYHSRTDKKNVGREMDLCPECARELKKFTGEQ